MRSAHRSRAIDSHRPPPAHGPHILTWGVELGSKTSVLILTSPLFESEDDISIILKLNPRESTKPDLYPCYTELQHRILKYTNNEIQEKKKKWICPNEFHVNSYKNVIANISLEYFSIKQNIFIIFIAE